jgi:hypothetical protein
MQIRDGKNSDPGSGDRKIRIRDPGLNHWVEQIFEINLVIFSTLQGQTNSASILRNLGII